MSSCFEMPLTIKTAADGDKEAWDSYVLSHPNGIAYQLFAWKTAVEEAYGFKGRYLTARKNNRIAGVLPLIRLNPPFLPGSLVSLPYCDAGGPLADSPEIEQALLEKAIRISGRLGTGRVSIRSTRGFADIRPELTVHRQKARMLLDLPENAETLLSSFKAKVRSQVRKPLRDGLILKTGGTTLVADFYRVYLENMRDLGSLAHPEKWFRSILAAYGNRALLLVVYMPDQTPAAGGMVLCHSRTISVPWASSLRQYNVSNPNMLLYWGFLKFAADRGFRVFDFGRSTPEEGTYRFKKQWGARPVFLHWADFKALPACRSCPVPETVQGQRPPSRSRKAAESVISTLPLSATRALGLLTRKYISL